MKYLLLLFAVTLVTALWLRFAPSSIARWHDAPIDASAPKRLGYLTTIEYSASEESVFQALNHAALATPRTVVLAGSAQDRRITYISRTRFLGAPDYTTVIVEVLDKGTRLTLYGRLRFGYGDSGVNRQRIKAWLKVLEPLQ